MYKITQQNLLKHPTTYQFSDVSNNNFLNDYIIQRESFLFKIKNKVDNTFKIFLSNISLLNVDEIYKLQKKFEVKKSFFEDYKKNINFMTLFSFQLATYLKTNFCFSLFSTFLKVNDTLTSLGINDFSPIEITMIQKSITIELELFKRVCNE
ncbi:hypothetical protein [Halarcobacter sp.]|uniref:hypothetical protein n=1 Tax=Halarcobacter sp. TaxID=2321133 RepID=UPI0029F5CBB1|nr:hypothetical protein [Halarcobacter sp.]